VKGVHGIKKVENHGHKPCPCVT